MLNGKLLLTIASVCVVVLLSGCVMSEKESGEDLEFSSTESHISYNAHDYIFVNTPKTWQQAKTYCQNYNSNTSGGTGYHLVTIEDAAEEAFLDTHEVARGLDNWWIGYSDAGTEGTWIWSNGSLSTYANWADYQPDNWAGNQNCAVDRYGGTTLWDDTYCTFQFPFICERDAYAYGTDGSFQYSASGATVVQQSVTLQAGRVFTVGTCGLPGATGTGNTRLQLWLGPTLIGSNDDSGISPSYPTSPSPFCGTTGALSNFSVVIETAGTYVIKAGCSTGSCSGTVVYNY
jgi:hypothetical protein